MKEGRKEERMVAGKVLVTVAVAVTFSVTVSCLRSQVSVCEIIIHSVCLFCFAPLVERI